MTFVSYAQNYEDVMLWRALKNIQNGFYIDVGACDPDQDSVTKAFYDRGWSGINIEPVQKHFDQLKSKRPRDINLRVLAGEKEDEKFFYEIPETGLSTLNKEFAVRHKDEMGFNYLIREINCNSITNICSEHNVDQIHFLKIDVEGAEEQVLKGIDFKKIRPWIIVVEATLPLTQTISYKGWDPLITNNNYEFCYFDGLNRFYVANEHGELKKHFVEPPNFFDMFIRYNEHWLQEENTRTNQELANAKNEIWRGRQQLGKLKQDLGMSAERIQALDSEIQNIYNSKAWKFSRPIRLFFKILRKIKLIIKRVLRIINTKLVKSKYEAFFIQKIENEPEQAPAVELNKARVLLSPSGKCIYMGINAKLEQDKL